MKRSAVVVAFLLAGTLSAYAQTSVHMVWFTTNIGTAALGSPQKQPTTLISVDPDAQRLLGSVVPLSTVTVSNTYVTPDSSFMVWQSTLPNTPGLLLTLRDLASGTVSTLPSPFTSQSMVGNPTRTEVYGRDAGGIVALSLAGARRLGSAACSTLYGDFSVSADGRRLSFPCANPGPFRGAVLDTATGATIATLGGIDDYNWLTLSRDGQEMYAYTLGTAPPGQSLPIFLRRYDVSTGTVLAETVVSSRPPLLVDPRTGGLFAVLDGTIKKYDAQTLLELDSRSFLQTFPGLFEVASAIVFDPHKPRIYAASRFTHYGIGVSYQKVFTSIDADTLDVVLNASLGSSGTVPDYGAIAVAPRPQAPTGLTASVQGNSVQLSWAAGAVPGVALRFVLEAGSAPGVANLATFDVGLQTTLFVPNVPFGTYYVRVRGANVAGSGLPSDEIIVTVP